MIFSSKNEKGEKKIDKILQMKPEETMVTRRLKPIPVGAIRSAQPGRTKKRVCKIRILSCVKHTEWLDNAVKTVDEHLKKLASAILFLQVEVNELENYISTMPDTLFNQVISGSYMLPVDGHDHALNSGG
jgi:hypothetical protein